MPSRQTDTKMYHFSSLTCKSEVTTCQTEREMQKKSFFARTGDFLLPTDANGIIIRIAISNLAVFPFLTLNSVGINNIVPYSKQNHSAST